VDKAVDVAHGGDEGAAEGGEVADPGHFHAFGPYPDREPVDGQRDPLVGLAQAGVLAVGGQTASLLGGLDDSVAGAEAGHALTAIRRPHNPISGEMVRLLLTQIGGDPAGELVKRESAAPRP
jgi:hypothetical protein